LKKNDFVNEVIDLIQSKKGYDITILDLTNLSAVADYFIICSGDVDIHVKAIADEIDKKLRKDGINCYNKEGYNALNWVLLDYFDVVIHVFKKDVRAFYNLEKLWGDAEITEIPNSN
jgi:ribosome-associated protein